MTSIDAEPLEPDAAFPDRVAGGRVEVEDQSDDAPEVERVVDVGVGRIQALERDCVAAPDVEGPDDDGGARIEQRLIDEVGRLVGTLPDPRSLIHYLLSIAMEAVGAERGAVTIAGDAPLVAASTEETTLERIPRTVADAVLSSGRPFRSSEAARLEGASRSVSMRDAGVRSAMCIPIRAESRIAGLLYVDDRRPQRFSEQHLERLVTLGVVASAALTGTALLERAKREAEALATGPQEAPSLLGRSAAMRTVHDLIRRCAPVDTTVLIRGETGTGKELVARRLHLLGPRRAGPFVAVNCAAIPGNLLESELFGHEAGAFTGAAARRTGRFEAADGGTLFLDEIGELASDLQAKLLRALESREVAPVGADAARSVDVRVVAATNRDLEQQIEAGRFREDLYYRLRVVEIGVPPLRERPEDIVELAERFSAQIGPKVGRPGVRLSAGARERLVAHPWRGNVRELKNEIERALIVGRGDALRESDLSFEPAKAAASSAPESLAARWRAIGDAQDSLIREALEASASNVAEAARRLGIGRGMLRTKLARRAQRKGTARS